MNLSNHFLIATPGLDDPFFAGSVIYLYRHSEEGAGGLVINKPSPIPVHHGWGSSWNSIPPYLCDANIMLGGPIQVERGFLLHTPPGNWENSVAVSSRIALTASGDILEHWADSAQVEAAQLFIGRSSWESGQLERELADNSWLTVEADENILFKCPAEQRYEAAMRLLNIGVEQLGNAGHA